MLKFMQKNLKFKNNDSWDQTKIQTSLFSVWSHEGDCYRVLPH